MQIRVDRQKMIVTMREAELSNATEGLAIERSDLPVGIANGALLLPRIVAKDIGSVSYRASHAPTQDLLVSGLSATSAMLASKTQKGFPFYLTVHVTRYAFPPIVTPFLAFSHERWVWPVRKQSIPASGQRSSSWISSSECTGSTASCTRKAMDEISRVCRGERQTCINASVSDCLYNSAGKLRDACARHAGILSVRVAMLYRGVEKTTQEAALQNVT